MQTRDYVELILSTCGGIGALFLGLGYFYSQFKQGSNQEKIDAVRILTDDVQALRGKVQELTDEVKKLRTDNEEERKKFTETILTLQGKDPLMTEFIKTQSDFMTYTKLILIRVDKFLNKESF